MRHLLVRGLRVPKRRLEFGATSCRSLVCASGHRSNRRFYPGQRGAAIRRSRTVNARIQVHATGIRSAAIPGTRLRLSGHPLPGTDTLHWPLACVFAGCSSTQLRSTRRQPDLPACRRSLTSTVAGKWGRVSRVVLVTARRLHG